MCEQCDPNEPDEPKPCDYVYSPERCPRLAEGLYFIPMEERRVMLPLLLCDEHAESVTRNLRAAPQN